MHDTLFNPRFTYLSPVHFDELDPMKMLHNSRFAAHVERAVSAWYQENGGKWEPDHAGKPDQGHGLRGLPVEVLHPVPRLGAMRLELRVEPLGTTSCVYGFLCPSEDGTAPSARGERTIVKIDPASYRPAPWSDGFRDVHHTLLKNLPAYA